MDVDKILREMDVKTLQDNIMHITFCNIEAELVGTFCSWVFVRAGRQGALLAYYMLRTSFCFAVCKRMTANLPFGPY